MKTKKCVKCQVEKEILNFNKNSKTKDGLYSYCKTCCKEYSITYNEVNKIKKQEYSKKYAKENKNKIQIYYKQNRDSILEKQKKYNKENREERKKYENKYFSNIDNRIKQNENSNKWREKNIDHHRYTRKEYMRKYRQENLNYKIKDNIVTRINRLLKNSNIYTGREESIETYLGCSLDEYKIYLESLFTNEMTWENYGKNKYWEIDHIRPVSSFDLSITENQYIAFHYTNTQPLTISANRKKKDKWKK